MPLGLAGMGLANSAPMLVLSLFVMGFGYSLMDICLNSQGFIVETNHRKALHVATSRDVEHGRISYYGDWWINCTLCFL